MGRSGHQVIQNEDGEHDDDYVSLNSLLTIDDEYNESNDDDWTSSLELESQKV